MLTTRREFLKTSSTALAGAALAAPLCHAAEPGYAAEDNTISIALVGCGGRGTGAAANALSTKGPAKLVALADVFPDRVESSLQDPDREVQRRRWTCRRSAASSGSTRSGKRLTCWARATWCSWPRRRAFRPIHLEYAVQKGVNVFMEKSFAVDAPGIRRVLRAGELAAQKNLKVASGLMWRHDPPREEVVRRLHDGAIGDIILLRTYRMHGPVGFHPRQPGESELAHQIRNYSCFNWLNASFFVDWLIHNIDVCCWAKNAWPVSAQGQGARVARTDPDQMLDQYSVEYTFADGAKLFAQGRHVAGCWDIFSDFAQGAKGSAVLMENLGAAKSRIYKGQSQTPDNLVWRYQGPRGGSVSARARPAVRRHPQRHSPTTKRSARPKPAWCPSWAAWPPNPASSSTTTKPWPRTSNSRRAWNRSPRSTPRRQSRLIPRANTRSRCRAEQKYPVNPTGGLGISEVTSGSSTPGVRMWSTRTGMGISRAPSFWPC